MDAVYVLGAGGIGCAVGYALRAAGVAVTFVEANHRKVEAGRTDGVKLDDRPSGNDQKYRSIRHADTLAAGRVESNCWTVYHY